MSIKIVRDPINRDELKKIAENQFGDMVKAVVDIRHHPMKSHSLLIKIAPRLSFAGKNPHPGL